MEDPTELSLAEASAGSGGFAELEAIDRGLSGADRPV